MPLRVYVASSWRNEFQPGVVAVLKADGHEVYDFRDSEGYFKDPPKEPKTK